MKRVVLAVLVLTGLVGALLYMNRPHALPVAPPEAPVESAPPPAGEIQPSAESATASLATSQASRPQPARPRREAKPVADPLPASLQASTVSQTVDFLLSPQATYEQKQKAWKQLRKSVQLDQVISELQQRMAANPRDAACPTTLGQAYLEKCATIDDMRDKGILALQADRLFEAALALDPSNWEARFTKAVAMTYWPASMNKGDEVLRQFETLIQQQQQQTPQPHFAETYIHLGDFYAKNGQSDSAQTVWKEGAALFPENQELKDKLARANAPEDANAARQ